LEKGAVSRPECPMDRILPSLKGSSQGAIWKNIMTITFETTLTNKGSSTSSRIGSRGSSHLEYSGKSTITSNKLNKIRGIPLYYSQKARN
jgi:hypothetical protein